MELFLPLALLVAVLSSPAVARLIFGEEICVTQYGNSRVAHVPTHSSRTTIAFTVTVTKTTKPVITTTPVVDLSSTVTSTVSLTLPAVTDTFTSTVTNSATVTAFTTNTFTTDVTVTSTTTVDQTVTASVAANFTPFASEAAVIAAGGGSSGGGSSKRSEQWRYSRQALDVLRKRDVNKACPPGHPQLFPQSVQCYVFVELLKTTKVTVAGPHTKTKTAPVSTSTIVTTVDITSTIVPPDVSVTVSTTITSTSTSTVTVSTTVTTTDTSISTSVTPVATYYPQCQSNNLIEFVGGKPLYYLAPQGAGGSSNPVYSSAGDPETCCELCANTADCAGFSGPTTGFQDCYLFITTTCDASKSFWTVYLANGQTSDLDVVGNGNCGQGTFGGSL